MKAGQLIPWSAFLLNEFQKMKYDEVFVFLYTK